MSNQRKLSLYIAMSLDGYIATEDDSLEWLFKTEVNSDAGYNAFFEEVDTIIIGKRTYDWVMEQENGKFPYPEKECFVFSKSETGTNEHVEFVDEDIVTFTNKLKEQEGKKIWIVGGGDLLKDFLNEKLVDEFIITVAPTLLGKGIPLFNKGEYETDLVLKDMKQYDQFAQLHYELKS